MILLRIDPGSRIPAFRQIVEQVVAFIEEDVLNEGDILPPTRLLASRIGVSRSTVTQAYRELWAQGYLDSRPGSYTRVRKRPKLAKSRPRESRRGAPPAGRISAGAVQALAQPGAARSLSTSSAGPEVIDFLPFKLDSRLFPVDQLRSCLNAVLTQENAALLNYAESAGYLPLRREIAARMRRQRIDVSEEEILVTHGSLQALELATKLFLTPGQSVISEQPTFASALPLFRLYGARIAALPVDGRGMDLDRLEARLVRGRRAGTLPAFVYTIPTFHNPTGITVPQERRERLLALCETYRIPLIEDCFEEEITYFDKAVLPIKSMDRTGLVLYLGSFSKVLFPGVRLGWVAAERSICEKLTQLKRVSDVSESGLLQAALAEFCSRGFYEMHLRRVNRIFARRMRAACAALRAQLPKGRTEFLEPSGGCLIWIRLLPPAPEEAALEEALQRCGVRAAPGSLFFSEPSRGRYLRLSISSLNEAEIQEGAVRLGRALRGL